MATRPIFQLKENTEDTLRQWAKELNHLVENLDNDTGYVGTTVTDSAINALNDTVEINTTQIAQNSSDILLRATTEELDAVSSVADSKIVSYYQDSEPTEGSVGDLWIDTNDGNKLYRWNSSSWVDIQDTQIAQAISDAGDAQATADGKIVTFFRDSAPTATAVGDLWVDTDANNLLCRWNGSTWDSVRDGAIAIAQAAAESYADGLDAAMDSRVTTAEASIALNSSEIELKVTSGTIGGNNLLLNPGFEIDDNYGWAESGTGWSYASTGRVGGVCGTASGALTTTKYLMQSFALSSATNKFVASCYVRSNSISHGTTNPLVGLCAEVQDGGSSWHYYTSEAHITGTTSWTRYKYVIDPSGWGTPNITEIKVYGILRDATGIIYFDDFQLEEGSELTAWKSNSNEVKNSSVKITDSAVDIASENINLRLGGATSERFAFNTNSGSPYFKTYNSGNTLQTQYSYDGIRLYNSDGSVGAALTATTVGYTVTVGTSKDYSNIEDAWDAIPAIVNHTVYIDCYAGTGTGSYTLRDKSGNGMVYIREYPGESVSISSVSFSGVGVRVWFKDITLTRTDYAAISLSNTKYVIIDSITVTASSSYSAITTNHSDVYIQDCTFSNRYYGLEMTGGGEAWVDNVSGTGNTYAFMIVAACMRKVGTCSISGSEVATSGGSIIEENGIQIDDSGWTNISSFSNSWVNFGGTHAVAAYKKIGNIVYLKGLIKDGTLGSKAFTLESGYYSTEYFILSTIASSGTVGSGRLDVQTNGDVVPRSGGNTWFSLNGLCFYVDT